LLQAVLKADLYASYLFLVRSKVDELFRGNGLEIIYQEENNETGLYVLKSGYLSRATSIQHFYALISYETWVCGELESGNHNI
jgi:hypothetical protein